MYFQRAVPCGLNAEQYKIICRDICRSINYTSPEHELAVQTSHGLICDRWNELPEWVKSGEIYQTDTEVILRVQIEADTESNHVKMLADELHDEMVSLFSHRVRYFPKKIFCIGWPKTGTTSITDALRTLGIFSWHDAPWMIGCQYWCSKPSMLETDFSCINEYGAISDFPVCALFRELDKEFPGSLFILTTRSLDKWVLSAMADIAKGVELAGSVYALDQWAYGTSDISRDVLIKRYIQHEEQVREYFRGRNDYLAIDLSVGNPWKELCTFLRLPIPNLSFPHKNRKL